MRLLSARLDDREMDHERAPHVLPGAIGGDRSAVHLDQAFHHRETDAEPAQRARPGLLALGEHLEDVRQEGRGHADAGVPHRDHGFAAASLRDQPDAAAGLGELGGVAQEIRHRLRQPDRIGVEVDRLVGQHNSELLAAGLHERAARLDRRAKHGREVHTLCAQVEAIAGDPGHIDQIVDEPGHLPHLALDRGKRPLRFRRERVLAVQDLDGVTYGRQRVAQLVRQYRQELVLRAVDCLQGILQGILGLLAVRDIEDHVYRAEDPSGPVADRVGVGQYSATPAVWTLDDDLVAAVLAAFLERPSHPALVVRNGRSVRREESERAAESIDGIVQLWRPTPEIERLLVEVCDQPVYITRVGAGG